MFLLLKVLAVIWDNTSANLTTEASTTNATMTACVRKVSEETEQQCWNCVTTLTAQNHMTRGHGVKDECSIWENRLSFLSGGELNEHVGTAQTFLHCGYYIFIKQATWGANKYIFVTFLIKLRQLFPSVSSLWAKLHIKAATTDFQLISAPPLDRGGSVSIASGRKTWRARVFVLEAKYLEDKDDQFMVGFVIG